MYRTEMKKDLKLRIVDFIGHLIFALLLPGPWWSQYLPELVGPILLVHGLRTDRILPRDHPLIQIQNFLHTVYVPLLLILTSFVFDIHVLYIWRFVLQYTVHIIWDQFTHELEWQKRSLWRI